MEGAIAGDLWSAYFVLTSHSSCLYWQSNIFGKYLISHYIYFVFVFVFISPFPGLPPNFSVAIPGGGGLYQGCAAWMRPPGQRPSTVIYSLVQGPPPAYTSRANTIGITPPLPPAVAASRRPSLVLKLNRFRFVVVFAFAQRFWGKFFDSIIPATKGINIFLHISELSLAVHCQKKQQILV